MAAGDLLQIFVESDDFMLGLCRLSADLLSLLMKHLVTHSAQAIILDPGWGRKELTQSSFSTI